MLQGLKNLYRDATVPPVVAGRGGALRLERGDLTTLEGASRVVLCASWSAQPKCSLSFSTYLRQLTDGGYVCVVGSVAEFSEPLEWPYGLPESTIVLRRQNVGYDFGTWSAMLEALPSVRTADHVLLTNDSMVGPFTPIADLLRRAEASNAGLVGLTDSFQLGHSIQSYFVLFNGKILDNPEWRYFFRSVRPQRSKMEVVARYEMQLARAAVQGAFGWEVLFPSTALRAAHTNPTLSQWKELLELGFPFIKRTIFADTQFEAEATQARGFIRSHLGLIVDEWLPVSLTQKGV